MRKDPEEVVLLRGLRLRDVSQRKVARHLGVSETLVSLWASGRRKAASARLAALRQLALDMRTPDERERDNRIAQLAKIFSA